MVEYSYDPDDRFDRYRDDIRDERRYEAMMQDAFRDLEREMRRDDPIQRVINDPTITFTAAEKKAINDPKIVMTPQGRLVKRSGRSGRDVIRSSGQFRSTGIPLPTKRTRKKTKMDRTMSKCLKMANAKLRNKNGKLKKGKTMSDVMKMAHRLCRKHG